MEKFSKPRSNNIRSNQSVQGSHDGTIKDIEIPLSKKRATSELDLSKTIKTKLPMIKMNAPQKPHDRSVKKIKDFDKQIQLQRDQQHKFDKIKSGMY